MSPLTRTDLCAAAPRLLSATLASAVVLLGAACGSASADDVDLVPDELVEDVAATSATEALVVAVGPSVGPVAPTVEQDVTPPGLVVVSPVPGSQVDQSSFVFEGFTEPGATVAAGDTTTVAEESGRWSLELVLAEGQNVAAITSTDSAGNEFQKIVTVNFEKPKPDPIVVKPPKEEHQPKPPAADEPAKEPNHEFSAWTKFGICSTEPFAKTGGEGSKDTDVLTKFKGSGVPGTKVTVISPYGGGMAEVDDSGYWWIKVEFTDGAAADEFTAVVTNGDHVARFRCGAI